MRVNLVFRVVINPKQKIICFFKVKPKCHLMIVFKGITTQLTFEARFNLSQSQTTFDDRFCGITTQMTYYAQFRSYHKTNDV